MISFDLNTTDDGAEIELASVMDMRAAEPLKTTMLEALAAQRPLSIKADAVDRMSTPCIQVLIAAATAMQRTEMPFKLTGPSDAFIDAFNDLGLFPVLKQWDIEK